MSGHLKKHHLDLYQQFKGEQEELNATVNEKKRKLGEDNEMEAEDPHTLRNQKDQQKFMMPRSAAAPEDMEPEGLPTPTTTHSPELRRTSQWRS